MITRLDWAIIDTEGRYIQVDFPGLSVISLYVPSGSSSDAAQARKDAFMGPFYEHLAALKRKQAVLEEELATATASLGASGGRFAKKKH